MDAAGRGCRIIHIVYVENIFYTCRNRDVFVDGGVRGKICQVVCCCVGYVQCILACSGCAGNVLGPAAGIFIEKTEFGFDLIGCIAYRSSQFGAP